MRVALIMGSLSDLPKVESIIEILKQFFNETKINYENVSFKGTINLDMPVEDVIEKGSSSKEITDFSNVIFKRV